MGGGPSVMFQNEDCHGEYWAPATDGNDLVLTRAGYTFLKSDGLMGSGMYSFSDPDETKYVVMLGNKLEFEKYQDTDDFKTRATFLATPVPGHEGYYLVNPMRNNQVFVYGEENGTLELRPQTKNYQGECFTVTEVSS